MTFNKKIIKINPNGFISFGLASNNLNLFDPTPSIKNIKFAVLAPMWASSQLDQVNFQLYHFCIFLFKSYY